MSNSITTRRVKLLFDKLQQRVCIIGGLAMEFRPDDMLWIKIKMNRMKHIITISCIDLDS